MRVDRIDELLVSPGCAKREGRRRLSFPAAYFYNDALGLVELAKLKEALDFGRRQHSG